ncbi:hypothetical protein B0J11DRAFT_507425 [Dendryphion nanum]|uniref:Uncharacterized protein n=1 Tax=Dendryphion nanum TaxID=256645 RepID=A0A9P9DPU7_9PLEO|nr:hypothetical protein B0J11DRAFT_507425 [Dendryphion nanum]
MQAGCGTMKESNDPLPPLTWRQRFSFVFFFLSRRPGGVVREPRERGPGGLQMGRDNGDEVGEARLTGEHARADGLHVVVVDGGRGGCGIADGVEEGGRMENGEWRNEEDTRSENGCKAWQAVAGGQQPWATSHPAMSNEQIALSTVSSARKIPETSQPDSMWPPPPNARAPSQGERPWQPWKSPGKPCWTGFFGASLALRCVCSAALTPAGNFNACGCWG